MFSLGRPARTRHAAVVAALVTTAGTAVVAAPAPADASITTLCEGYSACAAKGMGNAGYAAANRTSYWRMFAGHNCTNYAAYRMIRAGLPNKRPWSGDGNATNWGVKESRITNGVPRVGAIAWWRAGVEPAGSAGHVAYVEKVVSANEVVLSQDSWNGDFSWTRVTRSGGGWPSGFVHFRDVQLRATRSARISGFAKVDGTLSVLTPAWSPAATRLTYQWMAAGRAIKGATGSSYRPTQSQLGKQLSVRVVRTRFGYPAAALTSAATAAVLPGTLRATTAPTLRGRSQLGHPLTATGGVWTPRPDAVRFRWLSGGRAIPGATRSTYTPTPGAVGRSIAVQVIASRAGYSSVVRTLSFRTVAPGLMAPVAHPSVTGTPRLGRTLRARLPRIPRGARATVQWVDAGDGRVLRTGGATYRLGSRDLGSRVAVRVTVSRLGYRSQVVGSRATKPVRTVPSMRVATARTTHGVMAYVSVRASGLSFVNGLVNVRSHGRLLARIHVSHGVGRAFLHVRHGRSRLTFHYVQNAKATGTTVVRHVRR
ncbi:MAG: CHAP domain-containing protein [Marmoricola sp.]|nr:CHAP domain-containing protein [Marmoricola sp.]